ncbi:hypothetical protein BgiMline_018210, partial [Biomphalaria glabrata]
GGGLRPNSSQTGPRDVLSFRWYLKTTTNLTSGHLFPPLLPLPLFQLLQVETSP